MKLYLDAKECEKQKVPIDTALYIASLYLGKNISSDTFKDVCARGLVEFDGFTLQREPINIRLTPSGVNLIEGIFLNSEFCTTDKNEEDRYDLLAKKMQEIFPSGRKTGTNLMWRDSYAIISKRLKAVVKKYKVDFTDEEALEATRKYVNSFGGNLQYMQVLKYFIIKKDLTTGEENSQFLSYLENIDQDNKLREDWMSNMI